MRLEAVLSAPAGAAMFPTFGPCCLFLLLPIVSHQFLVFFWYFFEKSYCIWMHIIRLWIGLWIQMFGWLYIQAWKRYQFYAMPRASVSPHDWIRILAWNCYLRANPITSPLLAQDGFPFSVFLFFYFLFLLFLCCFLLFWNLNKILIQTFFKSEKFKYESFQNLNKFHI
jgi:hypothetical protein